MSIHQPTQLPKSAASQDSADTTTATHSVTHPQPTAVPLWANALPLQPALKINAPNDKYEREADYIAGQITAPLSQQNHPIGKKPSIAPAPAALIQREEKDDTGKVISEGASVAYEQLEDQPGFASWQEQQTDKLKLKLWDSQSTEYKAGLISFGLLNLGLLGTVFSLDPTMRSETIDFLQDKNLLLPTKLIPYSEYFPVSSFKYNLPSAESAPYTFETEFSFDAWFKLMEEKWNMPQVNVSVGVNSAYSESAGFAPFTGGNFKLRFGGGIIDLSAFHNQALPPTPMLFNDPAGGSPIWLMRSLPSQLEENLPLGSGVFLKVDVLRIPQLVNPPAKKPSSTIQRKASAEGGATAAPPIVNQVLSQPGRPLDAPTRSYMESSFGRDFSQVRIHTGQTAENSASAVNAKAFTVGRSIVFGQGQYAPDSAPGKKLLAHELVHVLQQGNQSLRLQRFSTQDCGKSDISLIEESHKRAIKMVEKAIDRLNASPVTTETQTHFKNHFGGYGSWRRDIVLGHFKDDLKLLTDSEMTYECESECDEGEPAYTYWIFGDIHICLPWLRSETLNERAETFIHEMHHWDPSRGHLDLGYHTNNADNNTTWIVAVNNADAYSELAQDLYEQP